MRFRVALLSVLLFAGAANAAEAPRQFTPAELRADFTAMYQGLQSAHFNLYAFTPKAKFDAVYRQVLKGLDRPLTKYEAALRFEKFAALAKMGHTRVDFEYGPWIQYLKSGGKIFPFMLRIVDGRTYVAQNKSGLDTVSRGDEITMLNGRPMSYWLTRTERDISAETPYLANSLMEFWFPQYLWVELGAVDGFDIVLHKTDGRTIKLRVPARTGAEMDAYAAKQPPVLVLPLRATKILAGNIGYLRPGPFYNTEAKTGADEWDNSAYIAYVDAAFRKFKAAGVKKLIIDLRNNPGGANLFSDPLIAWFADKPFRFASQFKIRVSPQSTKANADRLEHDAAAAGPISRQYADLYAHAKNGDIVDFEIPLTRPRQGEHFDGKVFVLIDRQSYSNCAAVAALVQDYGFGKIIGEATSDMATGYGAMEQFTLPNTGIKVGYPKAYFVRPDGDTRVRSVTPDIAIKVPVVLTPADEVLQQAVAIVSRSD